MSTSRIYDAGFGNLHALICDIFWTNSSRSVYRRIQACFGAHFWIICDLFCHNFPFQKDFSEAFRTSKHNFGSFTNLCGSSLEHPNFNTRNRYVKNGDYMANNHFILTNFVISYSSTLLFMALLLVKCWLLCQKSRKSPSSTQYSFLGQEKGSDFLFGKDKIGRIWTLSIE